jgi:phage terminase large subunit GpA-like protein
MLMLSPAFRLAFRAFRPSPLVRTLAWSIENIANDQGRPYDHAAYPHLGAPGGPMDAFDDARTRSVSLQWATRLGKTFFGQVALTKVADTDPAPMMFASSVEKLAKESAARIYASCHQRKRLNELLLKNEREQKQDLVEFRGCKIYVAWARSVSTLADKNAKVGHAGEYDKWEHQSTSKEAHPHKLFDDRFKDYQSTRKVIYEGTPTIKGRSPIERKRIAGTNCRYHVPCPHCKQYQILEFQAKNIEKQGEKSSGQNDHLIRGGVKWDRDEAGRHDPEIAFRSARYVCRHCGGECRDHHRAWMMRRGVWCPEGCEIDHAAALKVAEQSLAEPGGHNWNGWRDAAWIIGTPARDGADASYHLSSLYALSLGWGDIAKEFVVSKDVPQSLRNFINQWLGETWEIVERKQTWEELGQRLIVKTPRRVVPEGFSVVTAGIDKQEDHYVYVVDAWKEGRTSHTLLYGVCEDLEEIRREVIDMKFPHADGGKPLTASCVLIDSRFRPHDNYIFSMQYQRNGKAVYPCFGSPKPLGAIYVPSQFNAKSAMPNLWVIHVDTLGSQDWLDKQLHTARPGDPGSTSLYDGSLADHQDFLVQLLNDASVPKLDTANNTKEVWERVDPSVPNDYRDAKRYASVAFFVTVRGQKGKPRSKPVEQEDKKPTQKQNRFIEREGGWLNRP